MTRRDAALRAGLLAPTAFAAVMMASDAAQAACTPAAANNVTAICTGTIIDQGPQVGMGYGADTLTGLTVTVLSGASLTGTNSGLRFDNGTAVNFGTVTGTNGGVWLGSGRVENHGAINAPAGAGIWADADATVANLGRIMGGATGITGLASLNLTNSGIIESGLGSGVQVNGSGTINNSGRIAGGNTGITGFGFLSLTNSGTIESTGWGVQVDGAGVISSSGTITGHSGVAILFNLNGVAASDTLTVLPGARFGGLVVFGGGADTVNFGPGSWILNIDNFDAGLSSVNTSGNPYAVTANQIVVADLSGFGAMNRAVMDITGWIASVLPETPVFDTAQTGDAANAFTAIDAAAPRFDDAFANFPSALPYAPTPVFKGGAINDVHGNHYWAKAFGGRREQDTDNNFIGSVTQGFGGAVGFDGQVSANTRLGVLFGGSRNETTLQLNAGETDTDTLFGGVYSRSFFGATFLDLALIGGKLENDSKRNIGGGLAMETANASYDGWFVNPMLTLGHRIALPHNLTLTPALKARYVAAHFDGYVENGSTANLTVAGRDFQAFEERAEVTLASVQYWGKSRIVFRTHAGALAQQRTGDSTVNVALVGQNFIATTPDEDNVFGLYGGGGFDWQTDNVALFASGEVTGTSDNTIAFAGKGGMRVVW